MVPVQERDRIENLIVLRIIEVDPGLDHPRSKRIDPGLIRRQRILVGDPGRLATRYAQAQVASQLKDPRHGIADQILIPLDQHAGLASPEPVVRQDLVDHSAPEQLIEGCPALVHQGEDHVPDVAESVNRKGLARPERGREITVAFVRLQHPPAGSKWPRGSSLKEPGDGEVVFAAHIPEALSAQPLLDQMIPQPRTARSSRSDTCRHKSRREIE